MIGNRKVKKHHFVVKEEMEGQDERARDTFRRLGLTPVQIDQFFSIFRTIDEDGSGVIDSSEFYFFFDLEESGFTARLFFIFDNNLSGEIDFEEFVCALNYCSLTDDGLAKMALK